MFLLKRNIYKVSLENMSLILSKQIKSPWRNWAWSSRCCGLAFTQVKNIWLGCFAPGSFMTVCGCQGRLHMHSADPVELHWLWKAPWGSGHVYVCVCVCYWKVSLFALCFSVLCVKVYLVQINQTENKIRQPSDYFCCFPLFSLRKALYFSRSPSGSLHLY